MISLETLNVMSDLRFQFIVVRKVESDEIFKKIGDFSLIIRFSNFRPIIVAQLLHLGFYFFLKIGKVSLLFLDQHWQISIYLTHRLFFNFIKSSFQFT